MLDGLMLGNINIKKCESANNIFKIEFYLNNKA